MLYFWIIKGVVTSLFQAMWSPRHHSQMARGRQILLGIEQDFIMAYWRRNRVFFVFSDISERTGIYYFGAIILITNVIGGTKIVITQQVKR